MAPGPAEAADLKAPNVITRASGRRSPEGSGCHSAARLGR